MNVYQTAIESAKKLAELEATAQLYRLPYEDDQEAIERMEESFGVSIAQMKVAYRSLRNAIKEAREQNDGVSSDALRLIEKAKGVNNLPESDQADALAYLKINARTEAEKVSAAYAKDIFKSFIQ